MMSDQKHLCDAYISLVGKVNKLLHSRLWWATDFSSKNRFYNRLPQLIDKLLKIGELTDKDKTSSALGSAPWQICVSLKKHFERRHILILLYKFVSLPRIVLELFRRLGGGSYHFFRLTCRYCYARLVLSLRLQKIFSHQQPAYVIKTFVYDHSFLKDGTYQDVFFGRLPEFLEEKGERVIFFANVLGDFKVCLKKIADCPNALIIPIDFCSSFFAILKCAFVSCFYWPQVKCPIDFLDYEVGDLINAELFSGSSRIQSYQYLHYDQTQALAKRIPIKTFLMTYENNPWEKMCLLALRETSWQTRILGYQHTVTPQASVNMFISAEEENIIPKPDCVLTVGAATRQVIERYTQISSLPIVPACALRYENLLKRPFLPRTKSFKILLALEGVVDVYKMVNYVLQQLEGCRQYQVILRTHPVLPVSAFLGHLSKKLTDLPFLEISQGNMLLRDIERSDMTMYWGSTVALESLWLGKPLIHFDMQTLFSYDPLFDCPHLKWTVNRHQNLTEVLDKIYRLSDEEFLSNRQKAHDYLTRYFYPVNSSNLACFLP